MAPQERIARAYDLYGAQLYRVAYSLLQSRESAEDAVQDTFARYLTHDKPFRDDEHEKAWLIRVTINRCRDLQRAGTVRAYTPLEDLLQQPGQPDSGWQEGKPVLQAVLALPEKYRTVLVLDGLEGQPVDGIASALHITASAVKMRLKRGREMLQLALAKEDIHV